MKDQCNYINTKKILFLRTDDQNTSLIFNQNKIDCF